MNDENQITQPEIIDALSRSGYLIESRLLKKLSDKEYKLYPNEAYPDPTSGKSREIDILGISPRFVKNLILDRHLHINIQHSLIVECSNNPQPAVFFKRTDKNSFTIFGKFKYNLITQKTNEGETSMDFDFHTFTTENKKFHYNRSGRSSQYCSFAQKNNSNGKTKKWIASHPDGLNDVFNKIFDYVNYNQTQNEEWANKTFRKEEVYLNLFYPVIVLQNDIYEALENRNGIALTKKDYIVFEFIRFNNQSSSLLIDIVTESYFPEYIELIKREMLILKNLFTNYYKNKTLLNDDPPF